jgi:hypothetical protein
MNKSHPCLHKETSRHGSVCWYVRRGHGQRVRIRGEYGSQEFSHNYTLALSGIPIPRDSVRDMRRKAVGRSLEKSLEGARQRALLKSRCFDLTLEWLIMQVEAQDLRCAVTAIPFYTKYSVECHRHPFAPSIDRIDCSGGYTKDNVRVVVFALNVMLSDWGISVFEMVLQSYQRKISGILDRPKVDRIENYSLKIAAQKTGHYRRAPQCIKSTIES